MPTVLEIPDKLSDLLLPPARYKVAYGGRGSSKSWSFARVLEALGTQKPLKVLCARELQVSIQESVHALLASQIVELGFQDVYEVRQTEIIGRGRAAGTQFIFAGLRHNVDKIKSMEGLDIVWVEEAHNVSKASWETLIPTMRKPGSEIWVTFNPNLDDDETYKRFVRFPSAQVRGVEINHTDNPWFPEVLRLEMEDLKLRDYDEYLTVWEGKCRQQLEGAVYAKELQAATEQNRITRVPYNPAVPVHTFWDLGERDNTSIWFAQFSTGEYKIIDFYENHGEEIGHYLKVLQQKEYLYGKHWLPHDARQKRMQASIESIVRNAYPGNVRVLDATSVETGINAGRTIFPLCWFDSERCGEGLAHLRRYRYDVDPETKQRGRKPLHDEHSHAADAFRYLALSLDTHQKKPKPRPDIRDLNSGRQRMGTTWMGT